MSTPHIDELRTELLATLRDLRNRDIPMEPDRARVVAQVASVLVDSARVEVEYLRVTQGNNSAVFDRPLSSALTPPPRQGVITHKLK